MTLEAILTFAVAVAALAMKPGPGMAMVMSRAMSQGFWAVIAFVLGFCLVSILFLGLVVFGFKYVDVDLVFISILVKTMAAVFLIWLGIKGLQNVNETFQVQKIDVEKLFDNFSASIMLTLSNPLTIVFYAGMLPTIMNVKEVSWNDFAILAFTICVVEYVVAITYSSPFLLFRKKIPQSFMRGLSYFSSIVIILVGFFIIYTTLPSKDLTSVF